MIKIINTKSLYSSIYEVINICKNIGNDKIEIVVPDKLTLFLERFLFEKLNITCSFNIKVSSFNRFAKRNLEVDKEKQISKIGSIILINKILNENAKGFKSLKNRSYSFEFAEEIFKTISQLKSSKISYAEMKKFSSSNVALENKIQDLAIIYENYETVKAGKLDSADMFLSSTLFVAKGKENEKILFLGFDDFTAIEYGIIEQLAIKCDVTVLNMFSTGENKSIYNNEIYSQLKNIAYINQLPFQIINSNIKNSHLKEFFEDNLFSLNNKKCVAESEIVQLYSANSFADEIEFIARDIRKNIIDGDKYYQFGVAVYDLEKNSEKIRKVFEKYEINYYIDTNLKLNKSILYKFFATVFKYNFESYNQSHLIDIINSPFLILDESEKRSIIQKILMTNFKGFINENFELDIAKEKRDYFLSFMKDLRFSNDSANKTVELLKSFYSKYDFDAILGDLEKNLNTESKIVLSKSKDELFDVFDEILKLYDKATNNDLFNIFTNISSIAEINNLPLSVDCVKIVEAEDCKEIFDQLYIVNCTKTNAPKLKYDCGIITDAEIAELNFSNKLSPTIAHINRLSKLRLFNLLTMFENSLTISFSDIASEAIYEIKNRIKVGVDCFTFDLPIFTKKNFDKYLVLSKWDGVEFACSNNKEDNKYLEIIKNEENIVKNKDFSQISNENLKIFENFKTISSSNLENYFKCPFNNFLNRTMNIKPREASDLLSFDVGNILHDIMCDYYRKNKNVGDIYEFCKNKILKFINENGRLKFSVNDLYIKTLTDEAVRSLAMVDNVDKNSNFINLYQELDFKNKTAYKLKNIDLIGKVDRIDTCGDMFRIVDYKSGKIDLALNEIYYGNKLQLFLYSNAVEKIINKKFIGCFYLPLHNDYIKSEARSDLQGYFLNDNFVLTNIDKNLEKDNKSSMLGITLTKQGVASKRTIKAMDENEIQNLKNYVDKVSEEAVAEIKSGFISPFPNEKFDICEYCPYSKICLKETSNLKTRKAKTVTIESFKEVRDE